MSNLAGEEILPSGPNEVTEQAKFTYTSKNTFF